MDRSELASRHSDRDQLDRADQKDDESDQKDCLSDDFTLLIALHGENRRKKPFHHFHSDLSVKQNRIFKSTNQLTN